MIWMNDNTFIELWIQLLISALNWYISVKDHKSLHDDVIKWKHFPRYWPYVRGIHQSPVNSPHRGQWRGTLMFSLICARINGWVNNREAGEWRHNRVHYDVIVMRMTVFSWLYHTFCLHSRSRNTIMTSWYGTAFHITVPLWEEFIRHWWFLLSRDNKWGALMISLTLAWKTVKTIQCLRSGAYLTPP